jgi:pantothenate kinase
MFLNDCGMMTRMMKTINQQLILNDPVGRLLQLMEIADSKRVGRIVIGLVGLPGSGKSTIAAKFVDAVNARANSKTAIALSMDGFHLSKAALAQFSDPAAALARRGSPWTFDPAGLASKLQQLRKNPTESTTWPDFQHGVGDPVADAISVNPDTKLIIVEGLYLLHREHGWNVAHLLDECWALNTPPELAQQRLVARHMASWGFSREQALARLALNDDLNAKIVQKTLQSANYMIM